MSDKPPLHDPEIRHLLVLGARADHLGDALPSLEANLRLDEFQRGDPTQSRKALLDQERVLIGQAVREPAFRLLALLSGELELLDADIVRP